jgi:hypothetical protein
MVAVRIPSAINTIHDKIMVALDVLILSLSNRSAGQTALDICLNKYDNTCK